MIIWLTNPVFSFRVQHWNQGHLSKRGKASPLKVSVQEKRPVFYCTSLTATLNDSAGAPDGTTPEEGTTPSIPEADSYSSSTEDLLALFLGSLQTSAGGQEEKQWEKPLTLTSHSSFKDTSIYCSRRPSAQRHGRQDSPSVFSSVCCGIPTDLA